MKELARGSRLAKCILENWAGHDEVLVRGEDKSPLCVIVPREHYNLYREMARQLENVDELVLALKLGARELDPQKKTDCENGVSIEEALSDQNGVEKGLHLKVM